MSPAFAAPRPPAHALRLAARHPLVAQEDAHRELRLEPPREARERSEPSISFPAIREGKPHDHGPYCIPRGEIFARVRRRPIPGAP